MSNPLVEGKDLADITVAVQASAFVTATAGGAGNNTPVVGLTIDRMNLQPYGAAAAVPNATPIGAMFGVSYEAALAATQTLSLNAAIVQDSADGVNWATIYAQVSATAEVPPTWPLAGVVDTGATGGSTQRGVVTFGTSIRKARRYLRFGFTPVLSAANTDTVKLSVSAVLSGFSEVPPGVY